MIGYLIRRIIFGLFTIFAVSVLSFAIIQLPPGDYVTSYIASLEAQGDEVSAEEAESLRAYFGLGQPIYIQYGKWIWQILQGNFGMSFQYRVPVTEVIGERLFLTVVLALGSLIFIWMVAIPIGILSAVRQYSLLDYVATTIGFTGLAVLDFLLALMLMYLAWDWYGFSVGGLFSQEYAVAPWSTGRVIDLLQHMIIPIIVLGTAGTASLIRITRAKGMNEWQLILKYPVRLAFNPIISITAYILPFLVSGSVIVSVVLSLPTVGPVLLRSLLSQDMFLAGSIILLIGVMTVIGTLLSDILLGIVDPRVRLQ
ncbi:ABC transporter permease [Chloroflexi bacterium TSY]|nr:ABC transporter permease [Chloroflexi bacterium TSY]